MADEPEIAVQTDHGRPVDGHRGSTRPDTPLPEGAKVRLLASDGSVVKTGAARLVGRQGGIAEVTGWPHAVIKAFIGTETTMLPPPFTAFGSTLSLLWPLAERFDGTLGFGIGGDLAAALGYDAGLGFYVNTRREFGWYYTIGADVGSILGLSGGGGATFVSGGAGNLAGDCYAVALSAGEGIVEGIFNPAGQFVGVAFDVGVGLGAPLTAFGELTDTTMTSF